MIIFPCLVFTFPHMITPVFYLFSFYMPIKLLPNLSLKLFQLVQLASTSGSFFFSSRFPSQSSQICSHLAWWLPGATAMQLLPGGSLPHSGGQIAVSMINPPCWNPWLPFLLYCFVFMEHIL